MGTEKPSKANRVIAINSKAIAAFKLKAGESAFSGDPASRRQFETLLAEYQEHYQPLSPFERDCLEEIALCTVRLARLDKIEESAAAAASLSRQKTRISQRRRQAQQRLAELRKERKNKPFPTRKTGE